MFKWSGWNKYTRNKLNQIANGSGGGDGSGGSGSGILIVNGTYVNTDGKIKVVLDKTWQEIHDADFAIVKVDLSETVSDGDILIGIFTVVNIQIVNGTYAVTVLGNEPNGPAGIMPFITDSPDGYPESPESGE